MTQPHDYAALQDLFILRTGKSYQRYYLTKKEAATVRHALKVADRLMQEPVTMTINDLAKVLYEYMARCSVTDDLLQDMILVAKKLEKIGLIKVIKND